MENIKQLIDGLINASETIGRAYMAQTRHPAASAKALSESKEAQTRLKAELMEAIEMALNPTTA